MEVNEVKDMMDVSGMENTERYKIPFTATGRTMQARCLVGTVTGAQGTHPAVLDGLGSDSVLLFVSPGKMPV